jgi:hypothetical protein
MVNDCMSEGRRTADTSNKPIELTGRLQLSASPPTASCLPLRGSVSLKPATPMCLTDTPGLVQPCRPSLTQRTLIGESAHQTRNGSDLRELPVIASDLAGACRLPPAFRRPKQRRRGYYAGPPKPVRLNHGRMHLYVLPGYFAHNHL